METILEAKNIRMSFNGKPVLDGVTFGLEKGTVCALFGENGSGKTTLFQILSGFLKPLSGEISYRGVSMLGKTAIEASKAGIGKMWQTPRICKNLSVQDNLLLAVAGHPGEYLLNYLFAPLKIHRAERQMIINAERLAERVGLSGKLQKKAGALSFGQQKLLSMGMLLMNDAELLLMDEPFAGINTAMIDEVLEVLFTLRKMNKTIFMIEHNRKTAADISDQAFILRQGKLGIYDND